MKVFSLRKPRAVLLFARVYSCMRHRQSNTIWTTVTHRAYQVPGILSSGFESVQSAIYNSSIHDGPISVVQQQPRGTTATVALQAAVGFVTATRSICVRTCGSCAQQDPTTTTYRVQSNSMHTVSPRILGRLIPGGVH